MRDTPEQLHRDLERFRFLLSKSRDQGLLKLLEEMIQESEERLRHIERINGTVS